MATQETKLIIPKISSDKTISDYNEIEKMISGLYFYIIF